MHNGAVEHKRVRLSLSIYSFIASFNTYLPSFYFCGSDAKHWGHLWEQRLDWIPAIEEMMLQ